MVDVRTLPKLDPEDYGGKYIFAWDGVSPYTNYRISLNELGSGGSGASSLADLDDTTISQPVDGEILRYNGLAWVNAPDSGGGGGSSNPVLSPPLLADFPEPLNIGSETTLSNSGDGLSFFVGAGGVGTALRCRFKPYPTPPFSAVFNLRIVSDYTGGDGVGMMIRDLGGRIIKFGIELQGAGGPIIQRWNSDTSFGGTYAGGTGGQGGENYFLKFTDDGTNHHFAVGASKDGPFFTMFSQSRGAWLTNITQIGFGVEDQNGSFYSMLIKHYAQTAL
ncbi:hypothetical protein [Qipengyuania atrilutea]|uniref:Uncharacterized protein n=1 Tax=Qipengyuania atrilutea TaxID=2744473 RepID=A0A850GYP1_9SPHN|nr:hypothetical protein [Actirhodobacter atriluteus]NVD43487.1 hypothetical protein [Actirhodobacter atriluteus]